MTIGSGPWSETALDDCLRACGITPFVCDGESAELTEVLVVGHEEWEREDLNEVLLARIGDDLKVYSQEMILFSLAAGADVYSLLSEEELKEFGEGHPALEYLMDAPGYSWPSTVVTAPPMRLIVNSVDKEWPETGVLKHLGYVVGRQGLAIAARREILDKVMRVELVPGNIGDDAYVAEWGRPMSRIRLHKIANSLASFAVSSKRRRGGDYREAIEDWESDLEYLYSEYYQQLACGFRWPATEVL
jgi:hypothetical protein